MQQLPQFAVESIPWPRTSIDTARVMKPLILVQRTVKVRSLPPELTPKKPYEYIRSILQSCMSCGSICDPWELEPDDEVWIVVAASTSRQRITCTTPAAIADAARHTFNRRQMQKGIQATPAAAARSVFVSICASFAVAETALRGFAVDLPATRRICLHLDTSS
jgi:hypothetical protein